MQLSGLGNTTHGFTILGEFKTNINTNAIVILKADKDTDRRNYLRMSRIKFE